MPDYYDRDGKPLTLMGWAALVEDVSYKHVAAEAVGDMTISTVWLGLNHEWRPGYPPLIFETMIFGEPYDQERMWRYTTLVQAQAGHDQAVALCRDAQRTLEQTRDLLDSVHAHAEEEE